MSTEIGDEIRENLAMLEDRVKWYEKRAIAAEEKGYAAQVECLRLAKRLADLQRPIDEVREENETLLAERKDMREDIRRARAQTDKLQTQMGYVLAYLLRREADGDLSAGHILDRMQAREDGEAVVSEIDGLKKLTEGLAEKLAKADAEIANLHLQIVALEQGLV